jgi:hypothetical protein
MGYYVGQSSYEYYQLQRTVWLCVLYRQMGLAGMILPQKTNASGSLYTSFRMSLY